MSHNLESIAATLAADGKGILAADETVPTLTKRFDSLGIKSTEQTRRTYREMLFVPAGLGEFISGVILHARASPKGSTGSGNASRRTTAWAPTSPNGGPSFVSRTRCRAPRA